MLSNLFIESVQDAVTQSTTKDLCLVVYIADSNQSNDIDKWLKKWFQLDNIVQLKSMAIWLRLFNRSQELQYFEQIFPGVVIPSLYLIYKGHIKLLLIDDPNVTDDIVKGYWNQLFNCLKSCTPRMNISNIDQKNSSNTNIKPSEENKKTFKQQVEETTQQLYREKIERERRLDKEERDRILRLVKADREERKAREHELHLRNDNVATSTTSSSHGDNDSNIHDNIKNEELLHSMNCILQIKLTNGKSIRHTFDRRDTLNDVKKWVDLNRIDSHVPYVFHRTIPRYTFQESDELKTLESLELTPRSLLILKPLETSTNKLNVSDIENAGLFGKVYNTFSAFWGGYNNNNNDNNNNNLNGNQGNPLDIRSVNNSDLSLNDNSIIKARFDTSIFGNCYSNNNNSTTTNNNNNISRSLTPNVFQFFNTDTNDNSSDDNDDNDDNDKDKETYNGNNIKLEKRKDD